MSDVTPTSRAGEAALVLAVDRRVLTSALDLREALAEAEASSRDLVLDLVGVVEIDLSGVEFLASATRRLGERQRALILRNVAPDVGRMLDLAAVERGGAPRDASASEASPTRPAAADAPQD
jgi:anti-anti-sigma regulatory factor